MKLLLRHGLNRFFISAIPTADSGRLRSCPASDCRPILEPQTLVSPMRQLALLCVILIEVILVGSVSAQEPPYVNPLTADPPYYRVRYEGSSQPGELVYPVSYTVWIPPEVETLRGLIVHQHGCGEGSCKSGQTGAFDWHWQA